MVNDLSPAELIVDFVNTAELDDGRDELATPDALRAWLSGQALLPEDAPVGPAAVGRAQAVREAIRDLLSAHNEVQVDTAAATAALDEAAERARLGVRFGAERAVLEPAAAGVDGALGRLLAAVAAAMADGSWERLKACRDETCRWAFLDTAKNRSRAWCSMRSCGNRAKVRAYRERNVT